MKTLALILLVIQISDLYADARFDTLALPDGSPSGFRLVLPGTPAAFEARQQTFLPPAGLRTNNAAVFNLRATTETSFNPRNFPQNQAVFQSSVRTNPSFNIRNPVQIPTFQVPIRLAPGIHQSFPQPIRPFQPIQPIISTLSRPQEFKIPVPTVINNNAEKFEFLENSNLAPLPPTTVAHSPFSQTPVAKTPVPKTPVTLTPVTTEAPAKQHRFKTLHINDFVSTTQAPRFNFRPTLPTPVRTVPQFSINQRPPGVVENSQISGESLIDIRGNLNGEEAVVDLVTPEVNRNNQKVRVEVTKRVRGPVRKVVAKTAIVADRQPARLEPVVQRRPTVFADVPVTRNQPINIDIDDEDDFDSDEYDHQARDAQYSFSSAVSDSLSDSALMRQETRKDGAVDGSYSFSDGFFRRTVHYRADHLGYRIISEEVEPLGDGPQPDPKGHAEVAVETSNGVRANYAITSDDIQDELKRIRPLSARTL